MPPIRHKRAGTRGAKLNQRISPRISKGEKAFVYAAALKARLTASHFVSSAVMAEAERAMGMTYEEWELIHGSHKTS